jgi:hypothetical protein
MIAGHACEQEDHRHQSLMPRGHPEHVERQLLQCVALLRCRIPGFDLNHLDETCSYDGIELGHNSAVLVDCQRQARPYPPLRPGDLMPPKGFPPYPPVPQPHTIPPCYPPMPMCDPPGSPYPPPPLGMQHLPGPYSSADREPKGTDPQSNNLSNSQVGILP